MCQGDGPEQPAEDATAEWVILAHSRTLPPRLLTVLPPEALRQVR